MWWGYAALITTLAAGTIITLYTTRGFHGNIGCNDAVKRRCEPGEPSVCRKKTCRGTTVGGKTFKRAMLAIHTELR